MLQTELIQKALDLSGKSMEDMEEEICIPYEDTYLQEFSYPKFFYYILDRKFLIKYYQNNKPWYTPDVATTDLMAGEFWYAIMEYQSWNTEPLLELLKKI